MRIKGIQIKAFIPSSDGGFDELGNPMPSLREIVLENVLIAPKSVRDLEGVETLYGKNAVYDIAIPKKYNDIDFSHAQFEFWGKRWNTVGVPMRGIDELIPLEWNMKVTVELNE